MKNTKKKILTLAGIACFGISVLCTPVATLTVEAANPTETIAPRAHIIQYRYKEVGNKLYRRLFNYSTDNWVGEWEFVCVLK